MGNIVLLDDLTINKIAAGEVIERPANVVKEMVENSIDAGSTSITVEIENGGIALIRITDNGKGIARDDVAMSFERHATSKIRTADDISKVTTMGFRGEALASIASVSKVEMVSRTKDDELGIKVQVEKGEIIYEEECGASIGTSITVKELFYNTPVRYKFLKKDFTEAGYVEDVVSRTALVHPEISFKLINNHKTTLQTSGNGDVKSVIYSIYGKDVAMNVLDVDSEYEGYKIKGVCGKPEIARSNRSNQLFYVNGRFIRDKILSAAVDKAYGTLLHEGRYGFCVLNLIFNPELVDVNVHPAKLEVRFSEEAKIFAAVNVAIKNALFSTDITVVDDESGTIAKERKANGWNNTAKSNGFFDAYRPVTNNVSELTKNKFKESLTSDNTLNLNSNNTQNVTSSLNIRNNTGTTNLNDELNKNNITENNEFFENKNKNVLTNLEDDENINDASNVVNTNSNASNVVSTNSNASNVVSVNFENEMKVLKQNSLKEDNGNYDENDESQDDETINISRLNFNNNASKENQNKEEGFSLLGFNVTDEDFEKIDNKNNISAISKSNDIQTANNQNIEDDESDDEETDKTYSGGIIDDEETDETYSGGIIDDEETDETYSGEANDEENNVNENLQSVSSLSKEPKISNMSDDSNVDTSNYISRKKLYEEKSSFGKVSNIPDFDTMKQSNIFSDFLNEDELNKVDYQIIGTAFLTYIFIQIDDEVYIFDQHAAHERVLYERIKKNYYKDGGRQSQMLLLPDIVELSKKDMNTVTSHMDMFTKAGFELEEFGENTIKIVGVPAVCFDMNTRELFLDIIDGMDITNRTTTEEIENRFIATVACKAAVKANMKLSHEEIKALFDELLLLENPYTCPHGRPTAIRLTKDEIEKKFKRKGF